MRITLCTLTPEQSKAFEAMNNEEQTLLEYELARAIYNITIDNTINGTSTATRPSGIMR